jgi:hypothetical protein
MSGNGATGDNIDEGRVKALLLLGRAKEVMNELMPIVLKYPPLQNDPVLVAYMIEWQKEIRAVMGEKEE